jgi:hypothetical protein
MSIEDGVTVFTLDFVTSGLDPVVHADVQRGMRIKSILRASLPHGLPGLARQ